ncbi:MAG: TonB-dependent receptor plug domain-containing protein, partial [Bacteroidota bacterium]
MFKTLFTILVFFNTVSLLLAIESKSDSPDSAKVYRTPSITVTTDRASFGKSPVPFSELLKAEISAKYTLQDLPDLLSEMPSVLSYSQNGNSVGYSVLTMRGFDQRRISVTINGIPQNDPEDHEVYWVDFPDLSSNIESIQIQRGAGLTQYGSAAIGGSVNLQTSNFVNQRGVKLTSGIGIQQFTYEYNSGFNLNPDPDFSRLQANTNRYSIEFSSGLVGNYAFYGKMSKINSLGYRDRSWTYMNSYFLSAARFDENFTTQINVFGGPITDALAYTGLPKSYIGDFNLRRLNSSYWTYDSTGKNVDYMQPRRKQEIEEFSQPHFEVLNDWFISDNLTIKSALFYYTGEGFFDYDGSWADQTLTELMSKDYPFGKDESIRNSIIRAWVINRQGGWIPRMILKHEGGEFIAGAEIRFHRSEHWGNLQYSEFAPVGFENDYKIYTNEGIRNIYSVFARENLQLQDNLLLSAEFQFVHHNYGLQNVRNGNS